MSLLFNPFAPAAKCRCVYVTVCTTRGEMQRLQCSIGNDAGGGERPACGVAAAWLPTVWAAKHGSSRTLDWKGPAGSRGPICEAIQLLFLEGCPRTKLFLWLETSDCQPQLFAGFLLVCQRRLSALTFSWCVSREPSYPPALVLLGQ